MIHTFFIVAGAALSLTGFGWLLMEAQTGEDHIFSALFLVGGVVVVQLALLTMALRDFLDYLLYGVEDEEDEDDEDDFTERFPRVTIDGQTPVRLGRRTTQ